MMALAGLWSLFNLVVLVLLVVLAIFGIQALRKYLKTPAALPAAGGLSLGARLCRQRQARGMTVESVAQSLGITPQEVEDLFRVMRQLKAAGKSIIIITHKLHEVMTVADRVMVMRLGKYIQEMPKSETSIEEMSFLMVCLLYTSDAADE